MGKERRAHSIRQAAPAGRGWAASKGVSQAHTDAAPGWGATEGELSVGRVRETVISEHVDQYLH